MQNFKEYPSPNLNFLANNPKAKHLFHRLQQPGRMFSVTEIMFEEEF